MSEPRFTKGPWGKNKYGGIGAGLHNVNPIIITSEGCEEMTKADSDLILAGTGLYAALEESVNALNDYIPTLEARGASLNYGRAVLAQSLKALARARGEGQS